MASLFKQFLRNKRISHFTFEHVRIEKNKFVSFTNKSILINKRSKLHFFFNSKTVLTWAQYHVGTKNPYLRKIERPILKSKNNETFTFFKSGSKNITRSKTAYFLNKILFVIWKKLSCVLVEVKRID